VTEPTPFALHDLRLAAETVQALGLRAGVVVNRAGLASGRDVEELCRDIGLPIWGRIPDDRRVAEAYSEGRLIPDEAGPARAAIGELAGTLEDLVLA
jgi:MinD superfamily P-loop ATPase